MNHRKEIIASLLQRVGRSIEQRAAITFTAHELDVLIAAGLYDLVYAALAKEERAEADLRLGSARATDSPPPPTLHEPGRSPPPFTPDRLAKHWGVSKSLVYKKLRSGELRHFMIGEMYRITPEAVAEFERLYGIGK